MASFQPLAPNNHRITRWFRLESTSEDHLVHSHRPKKDQLKQVAQVCVQLGFEHPQEWRLHSLLGQLGPPSQQKKKPPSVEVEILVSHFVLFN